MVKTWYCVTSSYDDHGRTTAAITATMEAEEKPDNSYRSTSRKDIYNDWFDSQEEAQQFAEDTRCEGERRGDSLAFSFSYMD